MNKQPLTCGEFQTNEKFQEKWLGDQFCGSQGLVDSVLATIEDRLGKTKAGSMEIVQIIEDWRAQQTGGILSAIKLYKACILPKLLYNAGTWTELPAKGLKMLEDSQVWFLRMLLRTGPGCPRMALLSETGLPQLKIRIWKEKIRLIIHIRSLEETEMARSVWEEQWRYQWPGLATEVTDICQQLGIENANTTEMGRGQYLSLLGRACKNKNESDLKKGMEGLKKTGEIMKENCELKKYFSANNLKTVRDIFSKRVFMLPFAGNYSKDKRFQRTDWKCVACGGTEKEEQSHITDCPGYQDLRDTWDLDTEEGLVSFYRAVLNRRDSQELRDIRGKL